MGHTVCHRGFLNISADEKSRRLLLRLALYRLGKKKKCLVSGYPTDPNILGPTQTFLKTFGILKSIFRLFLRIFTLFHTKKVLIKKVCLPADPKNFGHVTGNEAYFSFGLIRTKLLAGYG